MVVNGSLAGPEIHFELRYYFELNELFMTNFYCIHKQYIIYMFLNNVCFFMKIPHPYRFMYMLCQ